MVPHVVSLGAELEAKPLVDRESLEQSHVPVLVSGLVDQIANALRVESPRCRGRENRRSIGVSSGEPLALRTKRADDLGVPIPPPDLAVPAASPVSILPDARVVHIRRYDAARQSSLKLRDATDLPSAKGLTRKSL